MHERVALIAFDIGGVLASIDKAPLRALLSEKALLAFFDRDFFLMQRGFFSPEQFLLKKSALLSISLSALTDAFLAIQKPSAEISYLPYLSVPYFFASNINAIHYRALVKTLNPSSFARKHAVLSCRLGFLKPHRHFFRCLKNSLRVPSHQILFIDDHADNCSMAYKEGLQTLCCKAPTALPSLLSAHKLLR